LKKGFVMDLANGQRVGVAVAEVFARRWRAVLSRGTLPKIQAGTPVQPEAQGPRLAPAALCGAIWAPLCLIMAGLFLLPHRVAIEPGTLPRGPAWWKLLLSFTLLPLGAVAPFGTTILGWIALYQIPHSRGRLYGLGLATLDALFYPLLVLDALIVLVATLAVMLGASHASGEVLRPWVSYWWMWLTVLGVIMIIDWLIVRSVWRAVNKPLVPGQPASSPFSVGSAPA
jgi:hypothetical protein